MDIEEQFNLVAKSYDENRKNLYHVLMIITFPALVLLPER